MKKIVQVASMLIASFLLVYCGNDDSSAAVNSDLAFLLAGDVSKTWRIAGESNDVNETVPSCLSTSERAQDNSYIYFADGTLEWDNGIITEGTEAEGACSDFRDLVGTWQFLDDNMLRQTLDRDRDNPDILINQVDTVTIGLLASDSLVFLTEGQNGTQGWIAFAPR